jgi:hypothetical protein
MAKNIRKAVLSTTISNLLSSILAKTVLATILCVAFLVIEGYALVMILPVGLIIWNWRSLIFELVVMTHIIGEGMGVWQWYTRIESNLYLGGIPMNALNHLSKLSMECKVDAVLAVLENYELLSSTVAGKPVSPDQWKVCLSIRLHCSNPCGM